MSYHNEIEALAAKVFDCKLQCLRYSANGRKKEAAKEAAKQIAICMELQDKVTEGFLVGSLSVRFMDSMLPEIELCLQAAYEFIKAAPEKDKVKA